MQDEPEVEGVEEPQASTSEHDTGSIHLFGVFLNADVLVHHFKDISEAINHNQRIRSLGGEGARAVVICKKKSGFTRQLMMGDLEAVPMEYGIKDWHMVTQGFRHLPDLMMKRPPSVIIVAAEDAAYFCAVAKTVFATSGHPLTDEDLLEIKDEIRYLAFGDVVEYYRGGHLEDDQNEIFTTLFSLADKDG